MRMGTNATAVELLTISIDFWNTLNGPFTPGARMIENAWGNPPGSPHP